MNIWHAAMQVHNQMSLLAATTASTGLNNTAAAAAATAAAAASRLFDCTLDQRPTHDIPFLCNPHTRNT